MKLLGLGARVLRMRPIRRRKSLSPLVIAGLGAENVVATLGDSGRRGTRPTDRHAKSDCAAMACENAASRFYLAVVIGRLSARALPCFLCLPCFP